MTPSVHYQDLGLVDYASTWDYQTSCHQQLVQRKRNPDSSEYSGKTIPHVFIVCEHPHVYTLGKSGSPDHLLLNEAELHEVGATYVKINRGGDITYHGPGQIVGYPILDLEEFYRDVHLYVRNLEEVMIRVIHTYGLEGIRLEGYTGVWLAPDAHQSKFRKICAIGVHLSRWVTLHGFAFNVNTDLAYFEHIIPCGINDQNKAVTSLAMELGHPLEMNAVKSLVREHFAEVFQCSLTPSE
ncbi:MAG: lipoyl(octanoyl) transferase LipB [Saprospiraceae bacterium]|nr:lipoyl(octanoyl) transferase LipB [Saprospiraceae bacterium]